MLRIVQQLDTLYVRHGKVEDPKLLAIVLVTASATFIGSRYSGYKLHFLATLIPIILFLLFLIVMSVELKNALMLSVVSFLSIYIIRGIGFSLANKDK